MRQRFINPNVVPAQQISSTITKLAEAGAPAAFSPEALAEAESARREFPELPDRTDLPFVTIDPEGSRDLDQAMFIDGDVLYYAIAAVSLFVRPGGALDAETRERATTIYLPDRSIPLHPEVLSTDAASLLPGQVRPAYVWRFELDAGQVVRTGLELARVRSRAQLTYQQVQAAYDGDGQLPVNVPPTLPEDLARVGRQRQRLEAERGGVSLNLPEQWVEHGEDGYLLKLREVTGVEEWNSQISLMTGMEAARIMIAANLGVLRTLPAARSSDMERLRQVARSLGHDWPNTQDYAAFVRGLDPARPASLAFLYEAVHLFRGAGYLALPLAAGRAEGSAEAETAAGPKGSDGAMGDSEAARANQPERADDAVLRHHAIAAPYAHVTAPLRRLVDRFGLELCRCLLAGDAVPTWVTEALPELPSLMGAGTRRANVLQGRALDALEGLTLRGRVGEEFAAVVVEEKSSDGDRKRGLISIAEPAMEAVATGDHMPVGERVRVRLTGLSEDLKPSFELV